MQMDTLLSLKPVTTQHNLHGLRHLYVCAPVLPRLLATSIEIYFCHTHHTFYNIHRPVG